MRTVLALALLLPFAANAVDVETLREATRCPAFAAGKCPAVDALIGSGADGIALAVRTLGHEDVVLRTGARRFLSLPELGDAPGRAAAVEKAMAGIDPARQGESLLVLGELAQPSAEGVLNRVALDATADPRNRIFAAAGLAHFSSEDARAALEAALFSNVPRLQQTAAVSLGRHLPAAAGALVRRALSEMTPTFVRIAAAQALVQGKDERAVPVLALLLAVPDASVKEAAAAGLGSLKAAAAVPALIAMLGDPAAGPVAARSLGAIGDARAAAALGGAIAPGAPKSRVLAALWALGDLKAQAEVGAIAHWLQEPDIEVARSSAETLGRIGSVDALPSLAEVGDRGDAEFKRVLDWAKSECQPKDDAPSEIPAPPAPPVE